VIENDKRKDIENGKRKDIVLRILMVLVTIMFMGNMLAIRKVYFPFRNLQYSLTFIYMFAIAFIFIANKRGKNAEIVNNTVLFTILILVVTFISYHQGSLYTLFNIFSKAIFWSTAFIATYALAYNGKGNAKSCTFITFLLPILLGLFVLAKDYMVAEEDVSMVTSAYYLLCLIPFVFLLRSRVIKSIFVVIIGAAVLISSKRTGFIAYALAIAVYLFVKTMQGEKRGANLFRYICIMAGLALVLVVAVNMFEFTIFERLESISDDGGSGRISVYQETWDLIMRSSLPRFIFGSGFNRVYSDMGFSLSAHTDFLEVLYDYGLIGFAFFVNMFFLLIKRAKKFYKEKSEYAASYAAAVVITIVLSAFSHLIIFNTYFIYLCMFFGLVLGEDDRKEGEKLCEREKSA